MNNPTLEKPTVNTELPSPLADIHDRVMEAYYGKLGDQFMRETQSRIHWICAQVKGRRILDVGCSQGIVPLLLAREGCQVTGVDTSPQAIEEAKGYLSAEPAHIQQNVTYINSDFLALDTLEVEPDTVVISEVLEHLVRPELFVEKAYDLLKQGGRLVITVPFGVNDFIDHKHTFYLMEPFRLLAEHLQIIEVKMLGKWLGIVAVKSEAHKPGTIESLTVERVRELEKAFEAIERALRENLGAIGKRLEEANKKYRSATEQITLLKPEAQKVEALSKRLQARDADIATLQESNRELLEANAQHVQELEEITQQLAEANEKDRVATEQYGLLEQQFAASREAYAQSLADSEQRLDQLQNQHAEVEMQLIKATDELRGSKEKQLAQEEQLKALAVQLSQAQEVTDSHIATITDLRAHQAALIAEQESQHQQATELLIDAQQKNAEHIDAITALHAQQAALRAELVSQMQAMSDHQAQAQHTEATALQNFAELQAQKTALESDLERHLQVTSKLQAQSDQANATHLETIAGLREQLATMGIKLQDQIEVTTRLQSQSKQDIAEKENTITTLRLRQAELEAELESELEYMNELQAQTQRADAAQAETIALLKARQAELEADLTKQRQAMNEMQRQSQQAYAAQTDTVIVLQNRQAELEAQLQRMNDAQAQSQREHAAQVNSINALVEQRCQLEDQLHKLTVANTESEEARAALEESIASLNQAKEMLEEQLVLESASRQAAEASLAATNKEWQGLRQQLETELNSSKAGLGAANMKYRTLTGEQIPQLKASLNQLLERSAAQQRKIDELNENLGRANTQRHLAEQRLVKTRASMTYQLGYQIKNSATSLGGLVKLPVRLLRLYRKASQQRQHNEQKLLASEPHKALLPAPAVQDENYLKLPVALPTSEQSRTTLLRQADQPVSRLKVACVMDEFTFGSYRYECDLMPLTPTNWKAEIEGFGPELLFIESAWRGKDDLWGSKVGHNGQELQDILAWCRQNKVPTVFWNKEDPVHFETFLTTAKQFDHVFTTDIDCIHRYKGALGHDRVYLLPFACQPALHNPIELYERKDAFCFAGAYYARYPERTRDLGNFVCELPKFRPLEIFDRNFGKNDANYQFPEEYQPYIVGTLPFEKSTRLTKAIATRST